MLNDSQIQVDLVLFVCLIWCSIRMGKLLTFECLLYLACVKNSHIPYIILTTP